MYIINAYKTPGRVNDLHLKIEVHQIEQVESSKYSDPYIEDKLT